MKRLLPLILALTALACSANPTVTATLPPPTDTPTATATPKPSEVVLSGYGENATAEQKNYVDSDPGYQARMERVKQYLDFLAAAGFKDFDPNKANIIPVWSYEGNLMAEPVIEIFDEGKALTFAIPFDYDAEIPVVSDGYELVEGEGPLPLTGGDYQLGFDFVAKSWVRYDLQTGEIVDRVGEGNRWESDIYSAEKLMKIPKSTEEISECVEIPDPSDVEGFRAAIDKIYLHGGGDILENWNGPVIRLDQGLVGANAERVEIYNGITFEPAVCVRFGNAVMLGVVVENIDGRRAFMWTVPRPDWPGQWDNENKKSTVDHLLAEMPIHNRFIILHASPLTGPQENQNTDFSRGIFALESQQGQGDDLRTAIVNNKDAETAWEYIQRSRYKIFILDSSQE